MTNRHTLSAVVIFFYLIPFLLLSYYSVKLMSADKSWSILSLGLLLIASCTLALILILYYWEQATIAYADQSANALLDYPKDITEEKIVKVTSIEPSLTFPLSTEEDKKTEPREADLTKEAAIYESLSVYQEEQEKLVQSLEAAKKELIEKEEQIQKLIEELQLVTQDFSDYKLFSEEQLKQKQLQLNNLQQVAEDQRTEMEHRQEQIHQLDSKIHDLSYEIKTLLYLNEENSPVKSTPIESAQEIKSSAVSSKKESLFDVKEQGILITEIFPAESVIRTSRDASNLLKKCIQIAEKVTGANHYTSESTRYREYSSPYQAIDQRRLFDGLKHENSAVIVVCSPKDQKIVFVNQYVKNLLEWSPEKFISDFNYIMHEGMHEWNKGISSLSNGMDAQTRLLAKSKEGKELLLNCHLGIVPTGLFRNYVIGVLYPT